MSSSTGRNGTCMFGGLDFSRRDVFALAAAGLAAAGARRRRRQPAS